MEGIAVWKEISLRKKGSVLEMVIPWNESEDGWRLSIAYRYDSKAFVGWSRKWKELLCGKRFSLEKKGSVLEMVIPWNESEDGWRLSIAYRCDSKAFVGRSRKWKELLCGKRSH